MTSVPPPLPPVWEARPADQIAYGGFWIRVVAYIIDAIVLNAALWGIGTVAGIDLVPSQLEENPSLAMAAVSRLQLVAVVVSWLYFALMESSQRGATVGKMAVGLRVVTDRGTRLSFLNATGRFFAKFISTIILCIGFIMVAFTDRKRGLHDMIAGTLVIKVR